MKRVLAGPARVGLFQIFTVLFQVGIITKLVIAVHKKYENNERNQSVSTPWKCQYSIHEGKGMWALYWTNPTSACNMICDGLSWRASAEGVGKGAGNKGVVWAVYRDSPWINQLKSSRKRHQHGGLVKVAWGGADIKQTISILRDTLISRLHNGL